MLTQTNINVSIVILTALGTVLIYVGQHKLLPSTSPAFQLTLQDFLVAVFLGIGTALINAGSQYIVNGVICWGCLWKLTVSVALGYLTKTIPANNVVTKVGAILLLLFTLSIANSQAQDGPFKYFFKSKNAIQKPKTLKTTYGDVSTVAASSWYLKADASLSIVAFQYNPITKNVQVAGLDMAGLGFSYQKISQVNGQNYSNLTFKALVELPTPNAVNKQIGGALGIFIWDNHLGVNIGYKYPGPFASLGGSWNF